MVEMDGTCEYVLDSEDPETWGGEEGEICPVSDDILNKNGVWSCPYASDEGENLCIFHLPIRKKDNQDVVNEFLDVLDKYANNNIKTQNQRIEFISAVFGEFDLSDDPLSVTISLKELAMDNTKFTGNVDLSNTTFEQLPVSFRHVNFTNKIDLSGTKFGEVVDFTGATFRQEAYFGDIDFNRDANFEFATFDNKVWFPKCNFNSIAKFKDAKFELKITFQQAVFNGPADFSKTVFSDLAEFLQAKFNHKPYFSNAYFNKLANFPDTKFVNGASFYKTEFNNDAVFNNAVFKEETEFYKMKLIGEGDFSGVKFGGVVNFQDQNLENSRFDDADLTEATFNGANLREASLENALLSRATLLNADFRGAQLFGAVLGDVRVNEETQFLGHHSDDSDPSPHTLSAIRSRPKCVYDPAYKEDNKLQHIDKAKSVYRTLEELGRKHARTRLQSRSFVRRQDLQKNEYKKVMFGGENEGGSERIEQDQGESQNEEQVDSEQKEHGENENEGEDEGEESLSWEKQLIAGARWSRAKAARATLLYGESPWRVIGWSLGIIFSFALLYPLGGWMKPADGDPTTYAQIASNPAEILNTVYYSTLTYTALGFGDFQPVGLGRLLTTVETGLGAVMLALLVFILGRRAAR